MKRKIAAILAADIAGYSKLVAEDEEETLRRLASYRAVFDDFIARSSGRVFNTAGDPSWLSFQAQWRRCAVLLTCRRACAPVTWPTPQADRCISASASPLAM